MSFIGHEWRESLNSERDKFLIMALGEDNILNTLAIIQGEGKYGSDLEAVQKNRGVRLGIRRNPLLLFPEDPAWEQVEEVGPSPETILLSAGTLAEAEALSASIRRMPWRWTPDRTR